MNKKAVPNRIMITNINNVLGISMRMLCRSIGMPINTFNHWTKRGTIRITELVKICNLYRIPFRCFLCFDGDEQRFRSVASISLPDDKFVPVVFHYERIKKCGRYCHPKMRAEEISQGMGICFNTFAKFYEEKKANNLTIDYFLQLCEVTGHPIEYFLDDDSYMCEMVKQPHKKEPAEEVEKERRRMKPTHGDEEGIVESLKNENKMLKEQMELLKKRMDDMERKLNGMGNPLRPHLDYIDLEGDNTQAAETGCSDYAKIR